MAQGIIDYTDQQNIAYNIPLFSGLEAREREAFFSGANLFSYHQKDVIFRQGDPVKNFYIVTDGIVQEFSRTDNGHEVTHGLHRKGDTICKNEMFMQEGIHPTEAVAASNVCVMELPVKSFREKLLNSKAATQAFFNALAQHSFMKQAEIEQKNTMNTTEIVALFIRQLCKVHGLNPRGFTLPYKKSLIASRLGIELETFSRTLPKLKRYGITIKRTEVSIHEPVRETPELPLLQRPSATIIPLRRHSRFSGKAAVQA